jgi:hypothetical protein
VACTLFLKARDEVPEGSRLVVITNWWHSELIDLTIDAIAFAAVGYESDIHGARPISYVLLDDTPCLIYNSTQSQATEKHDDGIGQLLQSNHVERPLVP